MTDAIIRITEENGSVCIKLMIGQTETSTRMELVTATEFVKQIGNKLREAREGGNND